jgi:hypothetical protein
MHTSYEMIVAALDTWPFVSKVCVQQDNDCHIFFQLSDNQGLVIKNGEGDHLL